MNNTFGSHRARLLALYLPQFHPIPENDEWWGPGFTEWTNVAKARPLFRGHEQPHLPGQLGFYDLRLPEVRQAQAELAVQHGVEAFCYWHYWFGNGRRILERPFNEVLKSGEPEFPFCLAWANQSWTGVWYGAKNRVLVEQQYPGRRDMEAHFHAVLPAFTDDRYVTVDGKPLFFVYAPSEHPSLREFADTWRSLADREGLPGLHLVGMENDGWCPDQSGFDASLRVRLSTIFQSGRRPLFRARRFAHRADWYSALDDRLFRRPLLVHPYSTIASDLVPSDDVPHEWYPCAIPNWDNTPRSGRRGAVLTGSTPELFEAHLREAIDAVASLPQQRRIVVIKSWNEWAEGNYLEPDRRWGNAYLEAVRHAVERS